MGRPGAGIDENLDHRRHEQECQSRKPRREPDNKQDRKEMLGKGRRVSNDRRIDQRKLIFVLEERDSAGLEMPARDLCLAGLPEHRGRKNTSRKRDEPIGDAIHRGDHPLNDPSRNGSEVRSRRGHIGHGCWQLFGSGTTISRTRPEPMSPAILPVRSKLGSSASAASAASLRIRPPASASRNAAPPGGSARTSTSRYGRETSASSPRQFSIGASSCSPLFIAQIVTIGYGERTISVEGCIPTRIPPTAWVLIAAKWPAPTGVASAA